jgi:ATP-dependent DNA helicase RecG
MAPTEVLAEQHYMTLTAMLSGLVVPDAGSLWGERGVRVELLTNRTSAGDRAKLLAGLGNGDVNLVVGTHALLTGEVRFSQLGVVVIDEQHRFGVNQRKTLREKSTAPHTLAMTATPIPRTLAQTKYADMDLSIIDELPPGRTAIRTFVIRESRKDEVYAFVRKNVALGRQAYVVAPAIDGSESDLTGALAEAERLRTKVFPDLRVDVLHGKMVPREKDAVMERFKRGETDVLTATTVVEVGVDVPNASVMVVLDAQRYGLAQLHQLRGRVGRGVAESFCLLVPPDDAVEVERLHVLEETTDGFAIAEQDLRLRRAGELAGTAQAGDAGTIGNIVDDFALYMRAKEAADAIVAADPELREPEHRPLLALLDDNASARALLVTA